MSPALKIPYTCTASHRNLSWYMNELGRQTKKKTNVFIWILIKLSKITNGLLQRQEVSRTRSPCVAVRVISRDFKASLKPVARAFGTASIQALHNKGYTRHGRPRKTAQSDLITCLRSARQYLVFIRNAQRKSSYKRNIDLDWWWSDQSAL